MTTSFSELNDRYEVIDALHRFAIGLDTKNLILLESAFTADAIADFTPAAKKVGMEFPVLTGRDAIVSALSQFLANYTTSHTVGNARAQIEGDRANLYALIEAQHVPLSDRSRHFLFKNQYTIDLVREGDLWLIKHLHIENLWTDGDLKVITG
jgi:SnoaL-like domain